MRMMEHNLFVYFPLYNLLGDMRNYDLREIPCNNFLMDYTNWYLPL